MKPKCTTGVLCFERNDDGSVTVYAAMHDGTLQRQETINDGIWGSIIANMSFYGEEDYGWYRAMQFHGGQGLDATSPLKNKKRLWGDYAGALVKEPSVEADDLRQENERLRKCPRIAERLPDGSMLVDSPGGQRTHEWPVNDRIQFLEARLSAVEEAARSIGSNLLGLWGELSLKEATDKVDHLLRSTLRPTRVWACTRDTLIGCATFESRLAAEDYQKIWGFEGAIKAFDVIEVEDE